MKYNSQIQHPELHVSLERTVIRHALQTFQNLSTLAVCIVG